MHPKTEQIFASLELLIDSLPFYSPVYRDTGRVYSHPFIWDSNTQGEFNIFNLCRAKEYIKSTDSSLIIKQWQDLEYAQALNGFLFNTEERANWQDGIESLAEAFSSLKNIQAYDFHFQYYNRREISPNGIIIGKIDENCWIGITSTVYISDKILKPELTITQIVSSPLNIATDGSELFSRICQTIATLESIDMYGDFAPGNASYYYGHKYFYTHKIVRGVGKTKELAWESTLQASEMLEIGVLNRIYPRPECDKIIYGYYNYRNEEVEDILDRYQKVDKLIRQELFNPIVYQLGAWTTRNIYIIGEHNKSNRIGIHIDSQFSYSP
jgi:Nuclease A inhibitor-like protein